MTSNSGKNEGMKPIESMQGIIYILVESYELFIL
jgi:hypothetical protein